jgi:hypothetical protein
MHHRALLQMIAFRIAMVRRRQIGSRAISGQVRAQINVANLSAFSRSYQV